MFLHYLCLYQRDRSHSYGVVYLVSCTVFSIMNIHFVAYATLFRLKSEECKLFSIVNFSFP